MHIIVRLEWSTLVDSNNFFSKQNEQSYNIIYQAQHHAITSTVACT